MSDEHPTAADTDPSPIDVLADGVPPSDASGASAVDVPAPVNVSRDVSARRRNRMLRIPDDEIARPSPSAAEPSPSPPAPQLADVAAPAPAPAPAESPVPRPAASALPRIAPGVVPRPAASAVPRPPVVDTQAPRPPESPAPLPADSGVVLRPMRIINIGSGEPMPPVPERRPEPARALEQAPPRRTDGPSVPVEVPPTARAAVAERPAASDDLIPVDLDPSEPAPVSIEPPSVEAIEPEAPSEPREAAAAGGVAAREAHEPEGEDIALDDEVPTPHAPPAEPTKATGDRASDPGSELSSDDLVAMEALSPAAALGPLARRPQPTSPGYPPPVPKPPLVIVPPHVGTMGPPTTEGATARRKGRFWWEDLFNDDYLRTCERLTEAELSLEVDFIEDRLSIERGGTVLDLACGTGRHAIELARRGYEVVGFDLSLQMLARAGEEAQDRDAKLNFVQGDMREMTFEEQFDGVYSWNTSFGYFEEDKNAQVIDRVHRSLKTGGLLLLDVINRDFLVRQSPSLAWFEGDGCVCMDEMTVDFITSRMKVKRTMLFDDGRSREIEYSMRVYSLHELGRILHEHRFKVCEVSGRTATPGVFFGNESPRIIILAEKR